MSYTSDEGITWEVIHDQYRFAKKQHRCDTCGQSIERGENYRRVRGKADGEMKTFREHAGACWRYG